MLGKAALGILVLFIALAYAQDKKKAKKGVVCAGLDIGTMKLKPKQLVAEWYNFFTIDNRKKKNREYFDFVEYKFKGKKDKITETVYGDGKKKKDGCVELEKNKFVQYAKSACLFQKIGTTVHERVVFPFGKMNRLLFTYECADKRIKPHRGCKRVVAHCFGKKKLKKRDKKDCKKMFRRFGLVLPPEGTGIGNDNCNVYGTLPDPNPGK